MIFVDERTSKIRPKMRVLAKISKIEEFCDKFQIFWKRIVIVIIAVPAGGLVIKSSQKSPKYHYFALKYESNPIILTAL